MRIPLVASTFTLLFACSGCQSTPDPARSILACRDAVGRFHAALKQGDRAAFASSVFAADEGESRFVANTFDLYRAADALDRQGSATFADNWPSIKRKAGLTDLKFDFADRPIVLLGDAAAVVRGEQEGADVYLVRTGPAGPWQLQAASFYDRAQNRAANEYLTRGMADGFASLARRLGTELKTEDEFRAAQAELTSTLFFGDPKAIVYTPKLETPAATREPVIIPDRAPREEELMGIPGPAVKKK